MSNSETAQPSGDAAANVSLAVLVADDDKHILELLSRCLQGLRHRLVGSAGNGRDIVALAGQLRPDLVILDIDMPGMDGIEAALAIHREQDLPIIISTGSVDELTLRRLRNVRIDAYLVKPFSPAQLKAAIYIAMARHRQGSAGGK